MNCDYVKSMTTISKVISATNKDEFKIQLKELLLESKEPRSIVYVWKSEKAIPRLKGKSPIVYIGKTVQSLHGRYSRYVNNEAEEYWERYNHIISKYGNISIDIYHTEDPKLTENCFLFQYHQEFMELPPINLQSYKPKLLEQCVY